MTRHGAHSLLPGTCLGRGRWGVPAARQASVLPMGRSTASSMASCLPGNGEDEEGKELPWPRANYWPHPPWPRRLGLTRQHCTGHSQWRRGPGGEHRWAPGETIPVMLGCPWPPVRWDINSTGTSQEPHQDTQVALSLLAEGHVLGEPWTHPAFCTCGQSTATMAGGVQPCSAPKTPPSPIPTCLSFTLSGCL